jgi:hypothetical protein
LRNALALTLIRTAMSSLDISKQMVRLYKCILFPNADVPWIARHTETAQPEYSIEGVNGGNEARITISMTCFKHILHASSVIDHEF